jgi:broad specificity phosphatase PhoE
VTTLLLWRHGQTGWNVENRFQGQTDSALDETGREQAVVAAQRLAARRPDVIVASDLQRAVHTAQPLARLTGLTVRTDPRLRERHFGQWQGHTRADIEERWPGTFARWRAGESVDEAGIEGQHDVVKRMGAALSDAASGAPGRTIVVVGHGGSLRCGLVAMLDLPELIFRKIGSLGNCHWSELRWSAERDWQLHSHNVG